MSLDEIEKEKQMKKMKKPSIQLMNDQIKRSIPLADVKELILWIMADGINKSWAFVKNRLLYQKVVLVVVPSLTPDHLYPFVEPVLPVSDMLPSIKNLNANVVLTQSPGSKSQVNSFLDSLVQCKLSKEEKEAKLNEFKSKTTLEDLLTSLEDRVKNKFPPFNIVEEEEEEGHDENNPTKKQKLDLEECDGADEEQKKNSEERSREILETNEEQNNDNEINNADDEEDESFQDEDSRYDLLQREGFVATGDKTATSLGFAAIDCEMCFSDRDECTRISIVDYYGKMVYDEFVKPSRPITDYRTQYSGITPELLAGATKDIKDVQNDILALVSQETILVGHSLENDLKVLKIIHARFIDTSIIYQHPRHGHLKPSLKWLAKTHLKKDIQGGQNGHDSVEDAKTCVDLVRMKLKRGFGFGLFDIESISLFEKLKKHNKKCAIADSLSFHKDSVDFYVNYDPDIEKHLSNIKCALEGNDFIWTRLKQLDQFYATHPLGDSNVMTLDIEEPIKLIDHCLSEIYNALSSNSLMIVVSGQGDCRMFSKYLQKKLRYQKLFKTTPLSNIPDCDVFTAVDDKLLERAAEHCRTGLCMMITK